MLARVVFSMDTGRRELGFQSLKQEHGTSLTRIEIANRNLMARDGSGPVRNLDMDTDGFWRTTVLLVALIVATPISWQRRAYAMIWGCLAVQGFILLTVAFSIWNESRYVELMKLSPFWQDLADNIQNALLSQLSLAVPALIWVLVTFRRGDRVGNFGLFVSGTADRATQ